MCMHTGTSASSAIAQSGSQWSVWTDGNPSTVGFSENAIALAPFGEDTLELGDGCLDVVQREDDCAERPRRCRRAPLVEQIVVVGAEAGEPELGVGDAQVEAVAGEAREVGEAELPPHAVDVHVLDPLHRVVTAGPDLVEARGAGRGRIPGLVEPGEGPARPHRDVGELALPAPRLPTVDLDDPGAAGAEPGGHPVDPEVRRLDDVVVGGHQPGSGGQHRGSSRRVSQMTKLDRWRRSGKEREPRGRAEVVEAVLDAARTLIAEQGPGVALRDIAEHAGVNFGLIYQYVGTKDRLVREVYARAARSAAERLTEAVHLDEALALLMTFGDGTTARLVGWAALERTRPGERYRDSPALDVLAGFVVADAAEGGRVVSTEDTARVRGAGDGDRARLASVR